MIVQRKDGSKLRILVAIASYGDKNLEILKGVIRNYRSLPLDVDIVVVSNAPKDLGGEVRVVVGLPSKNPWSLPFAHKEIFAQRVNAYDLFAYSEDDMAVTERNIEAFLRVTPKLETDEIAGYLRYEIDRSGRTFLPDVHGAAHWNPNSVRKRGEHTIAEFTNEHAAFYLLTQNQLRRAIASGGYLRGPYEGRYDMLCTAATDPYTSCGLRKVICISSLPDFLIHHLSNRYAGQLGLTQLMVMEQVQTLMEIGKGTHPVSILCNTESKLIDSTWGRNYYEQPSDEVLGLVPLEAKSVLSVGSGWGATEMKLRERGAEVTALPLDSVVGAMTSRDGIDLVLGTLDDCLTQLDGRKFDCVLISYLLHLQPNPAAWLKSFAQFLEDNGSLLLAGPNFHSLPLALKRIFRVRDLSKLRSYPQSGISVCGPQTFKQYLKQFGLRTVAVRWFGRTPQELRELKLPRLFEQLVTTDWALLARK